ncbi:hypothetical protein, partial [Sphingomonas sp. DC1200-1]|uniref:hypothetical protein n=1 Tax=Sphingomonas sp. DC1200-1 TaxID=2804660 RepID=UPI003CF83758
TADLIVTHVMGQQPVPDRSTLERVGSPVYWLRWQVSGILRRPRTEIIASWLAPAMSPCRSSIDVMWTIPDKRGMIPILPVLRHWRARQMPPRVLRFLQRSILFRESIFVNSINKLLKSIRSCSGRNCRKAFH